MKEIYTHVPDEEFVNDLSEDDDQKIQSILKELNYNSVIWIGSVYMVGDVFMGWDLEFNDSDGVDSIREFEFGSTTRDKMEEILTIFIENRVEFGMEVYL